jgi:hypothetical protein
MTLALTTSPWDAAVARLADKTVVDELPALGVVCQGKLRQGAVAGPR